MRGLVITDGEFLAALKPAEASGSVDIGRYPELRSELQQCTDHIAGRFAASKNQTLGLGRLENVLSLSPFESFCLLLSVSCDLDRRYERLFGYLQDDVNEKLPTLGLAFCLYQLLAPAAEQEAVQVREERRILRMLLLEPSAPKEKA